MNVITDIEEQKKNKDRYNVYINGVFYKGISKYVVMKYKLKIGEKVDLEKLKKIVYEDDLEKAKTYIANYHTNKTEKIIKDKLKEKGYEEDIITGVLEFLHKYNYISDERYAKSFTKDAMNFKKQGVGKIKQKLYEKGVPKEVIEKTLEDVDYDLERENLSKLIEKKEEHYMKKSKNIYEWKTKMFVFLSSRGFKSDMIKEELDNFLEKKGE